MLILARLVGEEILIGDTVVKITKVRGDRVWLGIEADRSIKVHRREVYDAIREEELRAVRENQNS